MYLNFPSWSQSRKKKLNDDKTEALTISAHRILNSHSVPNSPAIGNSTVFLSH